MYLVQDLTAVVPETTEPVGTKPKFWYQDQDGNACLFKQSLPNSGEHWAEKVGCELASLLGLPHAIYDLAAWKGTSGVVTRSFVPSGGRLVLGNELLSLVHQGYDTTRRFKQPQHTVGRVAAVLNFPQLQVPVGYDVNARGIRTPLGVFVGYLMLDAWIANQDRHHENWALLVTPESTVHLAPTFDHGSSLGRNETDVTREERLRTRDRGRSVEYYATRAVSALYRSHTEHRPLSTVDAFALASRRDPEAAARWLNVLESVGDDDVAKVFERFPADQISELSKEFALKLLQINKQRLLALRVQVV